MEKVGNRGRDAVKKQPCPYCRSRKVWYWGWYERKEGKIPYGDGEMPSGAIPLRRFYCPPCVRTFSWRPRFLVFGRPFAAAAYQQAFKEWALERPGPWKSRERSWYQLEQSTCKAFFRVLENERSELTERFSDELRQKLEEDSVYDKDYLSPITGSAARRHKKRRILWHLTRQLAKAQTGRETPPRYACHYLFMALAHHPCGACYPLCSS
jgi:hypothetical protein